MLMPREGASSGFTPTARNAAPASVRNSHHKAASTTAANTANQAICSDTALRMAGFTSVKRLSMLNIATLALPRIRRFTLYSAVNTRIPASSELMRSFRWISAVVAPTSAPEAIAARVATTGCMPLSSNAAHRQPPSGNAPSLERSGKPSRRNGTITPSATSAYIRLCASVTGIRFQMEFSRSIVMPRSAAAGRR